MTAPAADLMALLGWKDSAASWRDDALCAQVDSELFYPEKGGSSRPAKQVCAGCDVRQACLDYAVDRDERFGIWGGLSERERRRIRSQPRPEQPQASPVRDRPSRDVDHGTDAGYKAHRRLGEDACGECLAAHDRAGQPAAAPTAAKPLPVAGERPGVTRPWTPGELVEAVRFLTEYGMAAAEIAPELGLSVRRVEQMCARLAGRRGAA